MIRTVRRLIRFVRYISAYDTNDIIIYIVYIINKYSEQSVDAMSMDAPTVKHCRSLALTQKLNFWLKKTRQLEGGLNPILGGVGGNRSIMLQRAILRQSSSVMECITGGNETRGSREYV